MMYPMNPPGYVPEYATYTPTMPLRRRPVTEDLTWPSSSWTYVLSLDMTLGEPVGVHVDEDGRVEEIYEGLVDTWNRENYPARQVRVGDRLVAVNGIRGDLPLMLEMCRGAEVLVLELEDSAILGGAFADVETVDQVDDKEEQATAAAVASVALAALYLAIAEKQRSLEVPPPWACEEEATKMSTEVAPENEKIETKNEVLSVASPSRQRREASPKVSMSQENAQSGKIAPTSGIPAFLSPQALEITALKGLALAKETADNARDMTQSVSALLSAQVNEAAQKSLDFAKGVLRVPPAFCPRTSSVA